MASRTQAAWIWSLFATGLGVGRARESTLRAETDTDWMSPTGPARRGAGDRPESRSFSGPWIQFSYALIDIICVAFNSALAFLVRFSPVDLRRLLFSGRWAITTQQPLSRYGAFLLLYVALILLFCQWQDLYRTPRTRNARDETSAVFKAVSLATLLLGAFIYMSGVKIVSRLVVVSSLLLNAITLAAWRYAKRTIVVRRAERGIGTRNTIIVGAGRVGQALARQLDENKFLGYQFKGFLDENHSNDTRLLGKIEDLPRVARSEFVDEVIVTIPSEREVLKRIGIGWR
jgi:FlaA1/EpsC-like NDP-sugar epimerase